MRQPRIHRPGEIYYLVHRAPRAECLFRDERDFENYKACLRALFCRSGQLYTPSVCFQGRLISRCVSATLGPTGSCRYCSGVSRTVRIDGMAVKGHCSPPTIAPSW